MDETSVLIKIHTIFSILASVATIIGIVIAIFSAFFIWKQIVIQKQINLENNAKQLLAHAIEMSIKYPNYAEPKNFKNYSEEEMISYRWFVGLMLNACEEMINFSNDKRWKNEIHLIIALHIDYLSSDEFKKIDIHSYGIDLQQIIVSSIEARIEQLQKAQLSRER